MTDKPVYTSAQFVAQLTRLGVWATADTPISYAYLVQRPAYMGPGPFQPFSPEQRAGAEKAFALVAEVADLSFVEVPDNGVEPGPGNRRLTFHSIAVDQQFSGSAQPYQYDGSKLIHGADILVNVTGMNWRVANEGFYDWPPYVILHEVLHAVGLSHPGDYNGAGFNYADHADFKQDTRQYSVMSYWNASNTGADHFIGSVQHVAQTPLLYDILALQKLYGANHSTRSGNTVYGFNSNTGASPFNFSVNPAPVIAIWDGGGRDRLDFSGFAGNSLIDLNEGAFSSGGGLTKNVAIAFGAVIEDALGGGGADTLIGNASANRLDGGAGADSMRGGGGDDTYLVDHSADKAVEASGAGIDHVIASVSFVLGAHVEKLTLTGTAVAGTGNALANAIVATGRANRLDGAGGADTMTGWGGDDVYLVDHSGDRTIERSGGGTDLVIASVSHALGAHLENLQLTGPAAANGTGNALANAIVGTGGANRLDGRGGADTMTGWGGDDVYLVDNAGDRTIELAGGGTDTVLSAVSFSLSANVEHLTLTGAQAIDGTGNGLSNLLTGNDAANRLSGGGGADRLLGGRRSDTLSGGDGNDALFGGPGNDSLSGGAGRDRFHFDSKLDRVYNVDRILDFAAADDSIYLDRAIFAGIGVGTLAASAFRRGTAALDADDRILYDSAGGRLFYDADGAGGAAAILFARIEPNTALTHADFVGYI